MGLTKTGIPYLDYVWSPCGWGCSKGCQTCWARGFAKQRLASKPGGCPDCAAFKPHFHPERLGQPARRRKPCVIGVDFYADLFDPYRPVGNWRDVFFGMWNAGQHAYVLLTERPAIASAAANWWIARSFKPWPSNWFFGATIRNQAQADETAELWARLPGNRWLSLEPLEGPVHADWNRMADAIVIGCDNTAGVPWSNQWALDVVRNFSGKVYMKQARTATGRLTTDAADFSPELRRRELPWTLTKKEARQ